MGSYQVKIWFQFGACWNLELYLNKWKLENQKSMHQLMLFTHTLWNTLSYSFSPIEFVFSNSFVFVQCLSLWMISNFSPDMKCVFMCNVIENSLKWNRHLIEHCFLLSRLIGTTYRNNYHLNDHQTGRHVSLIMIIVHF